VVRPGQCLPDTRRRDHTPFWDLGYPTMMVTDTAHLRNPHHHQPTDTLETLNLEFLTSVCQVLIDTLGRL
jgi:aminopeptidase YwaD